MAPIIESIEIARAPEDVYAYIDDLATHGEWQQQITSVRVETDGPTRVGSRVVEKRRIGGREQEIAYEVTEHEPPRVFAFRGTGGPVPRRRPSHGRAGRRRHSLPRLARSGLHRSRHREAA